MSGCAMGGWRPSEDSGHAVHLESPERFASLVGDFVASLPEELMEDLPVRITQFAWAPFSLAFVDAFRTASQGRVIGK